MQEAVAVGLEQAGERKFFEDQLVAYTERRDVLTSYFDQIGLSYTRPDGAYFVLVDMSPIKVPEDFPTPESCKGRGKDFQLCWWIAQELKVASIPPSEVSHWMEGIEDNAYPSSTARNTPTSERGLHDSPSYVSAAEVRRSKLTASAKTQNCCTLLERGCSVSRSSCDESSEWSLAGSGSFCMKGYLCIISLTTVSE